MFCKGYSTGSMDITCNFDSGTGNGIKKLKSDAGCSDTSSSVTLNIMKALLSMDQFRVIKSQGGTDKIRKIQQTLNSKYESYIGLCPCDGLYGRQMNTALIKVLQAVEGQTPESANGNFGPTTTANLPIITSSTTSTQKTKDAILLGRYALVCNGYDVSIDIDTWNLNLEAKLRLFQKDMCMTETGNLDKNTWMALLLSKGNPDRSYNACDTAYNMSKPGRLDALKNTNVQVIARYIWGPSKGLDADDLKMILDNNRFKFAPIYQEDGTPGVHHFTAEMAYNAARIARLKAREIKIPENTIIYFAVDFDAVDTQITNIILPYFKILKENLKDYKVGIYGTRNVCTKVMKAGYAETCYVSDMSTGYSGNMGFKMPENWNFDQFDEISLPATGGNGYFGIDKVTYSGRYPVVESQINTNYVLGRVDEFNFTGHNLGAYRDYSGDRLRVKISATKVSGDFPENAILLVKMMRHESAGNPQLAYIRVKLDGALYDLGNASDWGLDYYPLEGGRTVLFEYFLTKDLGDDSVSLINAEIKVHIEVDTEKDTK